MLKNKLIQLLNKANIYLTDSQIDLLIAYVNLLNKWNKAYNLTSVRDPEEMLVKHIVDSIIVASHLSGTNFIDVGTGPGLPGIPLAIVKPDCHFTLVDSLGKRVRFLKQAQFELELTNIEPVQCRVEDFVEKQFDGVISRAFASLQDMLEWCHHLANETGLFYALKGMINQDEIDALPSGFAVKSIIELKVPELEGQRHLVVIKKE